MQKHRLSTVVRKQVLCMKKIALRVCSLVLVLLLLFAAFPSGAFAGTGFLVKFLSGAMNVSTNSISMVGFIIEGKTVTTEDISAVLGQGSASPFTILEIGTINYNGSTIGLVSVKNAGVAGSDTLSIESKSGVFDPGVQTLTATVGYGTPIIATNLIKSGSVSFLKKGASTTLAFYATGARAGDYSYGCGFKVAGSKVKWTTSDKKIATVSKSGKVTIKKNAKSGKVVTIKGSYGGKTASVKFKVAAKAGKLTSLKSLPAETMNIGDMGVISITTTQKGLASPKVKWSSSNPSAVTVDVYGVVTAVGVGKATITGTAGGKKMTCNFTVESLDKSISSFF